MGTVGGMSEPAIRTAFSGWPYYNAQLRDTVAAMTEEQLAQTPTSERWPMWATIAGGRTDGAR